MELMNLCAGALVGLLTALLWAKRVRRADWRYIDGLKKLIFEESARRLEMHRTARDLQTLLRSTANLIRELGDSAVETQEGRDLQAIGRILGHAFGPFSYGLPEALPNLGPSMPEIADLSTRYQLSHSSAANAYQHLMWLAIEIAGRIQLDRQPASVGAAG